MKTKLIIISLLITLINLGACTSNDDNALIPAKIGDKWGYIDKNGKWIINPQFNYCSNFSNGLAVIGTDTEENIKYGFIDQTGKIIINPQFNGAGDFASNGLAAVEIDDEWGYIDKSGTVVIEPHFSTAKHFSNGLAAVFVEAQDDFGYIDKTGNWVITPQFPGATEFQDNGLAFVAVGDNYVDWVVGLIDKTGKFVVNPQFSDTGLLFREWSHGLICVEINGKRGYIDETGHLL